MTKAITGSDIDAESLTREILSSGKYRNLGIPGATVLDLINQAALQTDDLKTVRKLVKQKMHNLVAPYLGDADYLQAQNSLNIAYGTNSPEEVRKACLQILASHASTRERIPILSEFYSAIFEETGNPQSILDLACGLNPFSIPWMPASREIRYHAYDIIEPRIRLINHFLQLNGMPQLAETRDILVQPPTVNADVAFFFKEAHRFEQRQKGSTGTFLQSIQSKVILVSLPTINLAGSHSKLDQHRRLVYDSIGNFPWSVKEILFENEIVFCIRKGE